MNEIDYYFTDEKMAQMEWFLREVGEMPHLKPIGEMTPQEFSQTFNELVANKSRKHYVL